MCVWGAARAPYRDTVQQQAVCRAVKDLGEGHFDYFFLVVLEVCLRPYTYRQVACPRATPPLKCHF